MEDLQSGRKKLASPSRHHGLEKSLSSEAVSQYLMSDSVYLTLTRMSSFTSQQHLFEVSNQLKPNYGISLTTSTAFNYCLVI